MDSPFALPSARVEIATATCVNERRRICACGGRALPLGHRWSRGQANSSADRKTVGYHLDPGVGPANRRICKYGVSLYLLCAYFLQNFLTHP